MKPPFLSPKWTWADVQRSATATAIGIDNTLPDDLAVNAARTAQTLECVEALVGPVKINSWYRCDALNQQVGGSRTSAHMSALAVDFEPVNYSLPVAFERLKASTIPYDQLIIERTKSGAAWIHLGLSLAAPRRQALSAEGATLGGPMTFTRVHAG